MCSFWCWRSSSSVANLGRVLISELATKKDYGNFKPLVLNVSDAEHSRSYVFALHMRSLVETLHNCCGDGVVALWSEKKT
jgi:hypothetical protein